AKAGLHSAPFLSVLLLASNWLAFVEATNHLLKNEAMAKPRLSSILIYRPSQQSASFDAYSFGFLLKIIDALPQLRDLLLIPRPRQRLSPIPPCGDLLGDGIPHILGERAKAAERPQVPELPLQGGHLIGERASLIRRWAGEAPGHLLVGIVGAFRLLPLIRWDGLEARLRVRQLALKIGDAGFDSRRLRAEHLGGDGVPYSIPEVLRPLWLEPIYEA